MPWAEVCVQGWPGWRAGPTLPPSAERLGRGGQSECAPQAVSWVAFRKRRTAATSDASDGPARGGLRLDHETDRTVAVCVKP